MKAYSFLNTIMLVNGVEMTGWAEGDDVIQVRRRVDSATDVVGAAGEMTVNISADKSGEFMIRLQRTSASNKFLTGLVQLQEAGGSNFVPVALLMQDVQRNDLAAGTVGYIRRPPDMVSGANAGNVEWSFIVERLDLLFGASPDISLL